ncbi:MAG: hypothetical protein GY874_14270 [Desulfobacteraceae bacterium]|nr:hypothetical protein [Desulfobacteraceae bacterium]
MTQAAIEPIKASDLSKGLFVPGEVFDRVLEELDWTYHQLARGELPSPFKTLEEFQLAIICDDPLLWCQAFLREPEDPDHKEPYNFFDYQIESLRYDGSTIHKCGAEVGKTREIVAWVMHKMFTAPGGSGIIGAPQQTHLDEIIEALVDQFNWNPDLTAVLKRHKKHPHHAFYLNNGFKVDFRPSGHDGEAYRGVHVRTFAIKDEAAKDKNKRQWSEFWRAMKPGAVAKIYSVPDGDRSCEFFKLGQRAARTSSDAPKIEGMSGHLKNLEFRLFKWAKTAMPYPYWSKERKKFYVEQFGGEDAPEYQHNVLGEDGDPENTVFPWHQLKLCIKDVPEYRALKILVDTSQGEVIVTGYRCLYTVKDGEPIPQTQTLIDKVYSKARFFDRQKDQGSEFTQLIKQFFVSAPGAKRGGADLGFSGDPTEIIVKNIIGKRERLVARLQLKHVTYDQQCQALDALDDVYAPAESITWGTDFGNAGSAVAHDLQGLEIYEDKDYDDRLRGYMFESTADNVDEDGDPVIDAKTGKPAKITLKELATDILVKKMQRQELEYPPDPDIVLFYTNHTVRMGQRHRIFKKEDDHLIDADRTQMLAKLLSEVVEDIFV